jgi:peptide deformylase
MMDDKKVNHLDIIKYPNEILRQKTALVDKITEEIFDLVEAMKKTMLKNEGVGLAANQVGKNHRLFVLNTTPYEDVPTPIIVINPEIINQEGADTDEEGCLSFPDLRIDIERPKMIRLQMQTIYNEKVILEIQDFLARAACHEIDHLNGVLFIERVLEKDKAKVQKYLEEHFASRGR